MEWTGPPGNPDSVIHRSRMYCASDRSPSRAWRPDPKAPTQARSSAPASRGTRVRRLRQVLEPLDDNLDVLLRGVRRIPEVVEVHSHALAAWRRDTRRELVLGNDVRPHRIPAA